MILNEISDPHAWMEKEVHAVLDRFKDQLVGKDDDELIHVVRSDRKGHGSLHYSPVKRLLPYINSWRAKNKGSSN